MKTGTTAFQKVLTENGCPQFLPQMSEKYQTPEETSYTQEQ